MQEEKVAELKYCIVARSSQNHHFRDFLWLWKNNKNMRHWICIPFLTCLPICKYLVTRSGERDLQTGKLKSQVWLCVCTVYSYRSWWRWKSWMFFARSSISRCHPMIKSPSTVAQLSDSESRKNLSVSNGWMTRTRLPELCHTAFDCHRWTQRKAEGSYC